MRVSSLHDKLAANGAVFGGRYGIEVVSGVAGLSTEYGYIRNGAGLTDFSFMQMYSIPEEAAVTVLDELFAGNIARVRFGRMLHTFLADDDGHLIADCYIANNDEEFIIVCESIVSDTALHEFFERKGAFKAGLKDITGEHVLLSVDGYQAWAVIKERFGVDTLGLPYLSIEVYQFNGVDVRLFRAGKTSEFGYLVMAPKEAGEGLFDAFLASVRKHGGGLCGVSVHNDLRLEGRFFNIHAEGLSVRNPLCLGLQWMIDFGKEKFSGKEAVDKRREAGLAKKIIGIRSNAGPELFSVGSEIYNSGRPVATIEAACYSPTLDCRVGLALFPVDIAYSGLVFRLGSADGPAVATISMPPIMPRSLTVKLDEM